MIPAPIGEHAKAYGAFYTDAVVADFLVWWAVRNSGDTLLDPSFGGGVFLEAAANNLRARGGDPAKRVIGVELDSEVHAQVSSQLKATHGLEPANLIRSDFFRLDPTRLAPLDAVIGNPPFIRYQSFTGEARTRALERAQDQGVTLSKLASSWAAFVVHSTAFLKPGGRLAMVIPMELGHAAYARPVLEFLCNSFARTTLITFEKRLFPDIDQDTLLVLAEGKAHASTGLFWLDLASAEDLPSLQAGGHELPGTERLDVSRLTSGQDRLVMHMIPKEALELYRALSESHGVRRLGELATVDIGYVTGANGFFHLSPDDMAKWQIPAPYLRPAVFRSKAFRGLTFSRENWCGAARAGNAGYVLDLANQGKLPESVWRYLDHGLQQGIDQRHKCRTRTPWYAVKQIDAPDAFLTYMSGRKPRLVANEARAAASNTLQTVRLHPGSSLTGKTLAALWQTSLTALSVELEGHTLGGGMLKLEPGEAKRVVLPCPLTSVDAFATELDALLCRGEYDQVRVLADRLVLQDALGLSDGEVRVLGDAAALLRTRRHAL